MKPWVDVYIGLGSNLHQPLEQAQQAIKALSQHRHLSNVTASPLYSSKPVGPQDQPDYINGCLLYTSPSPRDKRQSRMPSSA